MAAVLEVFDLRKRYRTRDPWAVEGVSFKLEEGQAFGLLGPNGAGKSTVVKVIVGLTRPNSGRRRHQVLVCIRGRDLCSALLVGAPKAGLIRPT